MKKLIIFLVLVLCFIHAACVLADTEEPVNTSISASSWTLIQLNGLTPCKSYVFQTRDGSDFKWKKTEGSTNYFTVRSGMAVTVNFNRERKPTALFYAQTISGDSVVEVFVFNEN